MSVVIVSIRLHEIGDFDFRIKQKTLSYISGHFSNRILQIYVFFLTMQRSCRNIISIILYGKKKTSVLHNKNNRLNKCMNKYTIFYNHSSNHGLLNSYTQIYPIKSVCNQSIKKKNRAPYLKRYPTKTKWTNLLNNNHLNRLFFNWI